MIHRTWRSFSILFEGWVVCKFALQILTSIHFDIVLELILILEFGNCVKCLHLYYHHFSCIGMFCCVFQALCFCLACVTGTAYAANILPLDRVNAVLHQLEMAHEKHQQVCHSSCLCVLLDLYSFGWKPFYQIFQIDIIQQLISSLSLKCWCQKSWIK